MKIALISDYSIPYTTAHYFKSVLVKKKIQHKFFYPYDQRNIPSDYNIYFYIDFGGHYLIYPNENVLKILYIIDTHTNFELARFLIRFADVVFCAQKNSLPKIKKINGNVYWLPLGCDPEIHSVSKNPKNRKKKFDIGFVGGVGYGKRKDYLNRIKELYPNSYISTAPKEKIGKIYSRSKIVLNVSINNDINMRFFEALASGSLLITDYIQDNGFEEILNGFNNQSLVFYKSFDDLKEKIDYYLTHKKEREKIASYGKENSKKNTYIDRWNSIEESLNNLTVIKRSKLFYWLYFAYFEVYFFLFKVKLKISLLMRKLL